MKNITPGQGTMIEQAKFIEKELVVALKNEKLDSNRCIAGGWISWKFN